MMDRLLSKKFLLPLLFTLIGLKFLILPIIEWQAEKVASIKVKNLQLAKIAYASSGQLVSNSAKQDLLSEVVSAERYFFVDSDSTKIDIQRAVEAAFVDAGLVVTRFVWLVDADGPIRVLRAGIYFTGNTQQMMRAFWELLSWPQATRQLEWNQQMKSSGPEDCCSTFGNLTLEFYATKRSVSPKEMPAQPKNDENLSKIAVAQSAK